MSPLARETEPIYTQKAGSERGGKGEAVEGAMFGKADADADEFGVITAGSDRGGAGRVKRSWRDKRATSRVADEEGRRLRGSLASNSSHRIESSKTDMHLLLC